MNLDQRETATVLAALRFFEANFSDATQVKEEMPFLFSECEPLFNEEIDDLCQRINCGATRPLQQSNWLEGEEKNG